MDNFFKFIDALDEAILVLYDKSFFYVNRYLLMNLNYLDKKRPVSLNQLIDPTWLKSLKKLSENDTTTIVLKMKKGKEKKYTAKMYPFQFEHSNCQCYMLSSKEEIDQEFFSINWFIQKLPFPVIVFDKLGNTFQKNEPFDKEIKNKIQNFADLSKQFSISKDLNFSKQDIYSFPSPEAKDKTLYLLQHSTKTYYTFRIGVIQSPKEVTESVDLVGLKQSFDQSIKRLQQLNGSETKFSHINSQEIAEEIDTLRDLFKDFNSGELQENVRVNQIDLPEIIANELEILKANEFFSKEIIFQTELDTCAATFKGDFQEGIKVVKTVIDQAVKEICIQKLKQIVFKTYEMENKVFLQIIGVQENNDQDAVVQKPDDNISPEKTNGMQKVIQSNRNQLQSMDVQISFDEKYKEYFDLMLTLKKN